MKQLTRQCFQCSGEFVAAFSIEEVTATYADMEEMGIASPPYPDFDIILPANIIVRPNEPTYKDQDAIDEAVECFKRWKIKLRYDNSVGTGWFFDKERGGWWSIDEVNDDNLRKSRDRILDSGKKFLIVALATRNVKKEVCVNKAAKLGIGKKAREGYAITTTLRIGEITESAFEGNGHHASPRPHLRRGHIRRQHYGPQMSYVKKVWIAPTFVNADEDFIEKRTAYNLSGEVK